MGQRAPAFVVAFSLAPGPTHLYSEFHTTVAQVPGGRSMRSASASRLFRRLGPAILFTLAGSLWWATLAFCLENVILLQVN